MSEYKVALMGSGGVGKSSLIIQFYSAKFVDFYDPTIEDIFRTTREIDGQSCYLDIMDTAGQEEFSAMQGGWIEHGDGFLLVYSVNERIGYEKLEHVRKNILRIKDSPDFPLVLVGNKCDLPSNERKVTESEAKTLAAQWKIKSMETSAKERVNVDEAFFTLVREMRKHAQTKQHAENRNTNKNGKKLCQLL